MVTAIVIPIICIYFYWLTKKEMKEFHQKWLNLEHVKEEALITGRVEDIHFEKQKYYYFKYIYVMEIRLVTEFKNIRVKKIIPFTKDKVLPSFQKGDHIRLYGLWEDNCFIMNRYEKIGDQKSQ